ncbi:TIGR02117 family protein [Desulfococcus sp.]|uniref:TIGR02117 family protein n=1 Tax=Desulfococcus sp. TaxID=2025834 RepID=UPI00359445EB
MNALSHASRKGRTTGGASGIFFPLIGMALAAAVAILSACSAKPHVVLPEFKAESGISSKRIYIVNHGRHTGVIFPAPELNEEAPGLRDRFGEATYFEFGWGDEGFYRARRVTSGLAVKALFWPTAAVLHVVAVAGSPEDYFSGSEVVALPVRTEGFESLKKFILQSFARDTGGNICPLEAGIYGDSQFYRAVGTYSCMNTCNTWTARAVKSAGKKIPPARSLPSGSVMNGPGRAGESRPEASR